MRPRERRADATGLVFSPDSAWLAWSHPGPGPAAPAQAGRDSPTCPSSTRPAALQRLRARRSPPTASTSRSCPSGPSTRSTTRTSSTCRSRTAAARTWSRWPPTTPSPFGPQRTAAGGRRRRPKDDDEGRRGRQGDKDRRPRRTAPPPATRSSTSRASPTGSSPFPVEAAATPRCARPRAACSGCGTRCPACSATAPATPTTQPPGRRWSATTSASAHCEELADDARRLRGQRRRQPAAGPRPAASCGSCSADSKAGGRRRGRRTSPSTCPGSALTVDPAAEWRQMYDEAGRLMRDNFWRADMGGVDWDGVARALPAAAGPDRHPRRPRRPAVGGARRARHLARLRHAAGGTATRATRQGLLGADLARRRTGAGGSTGSCPASPPTRAPAPRSPRPASRSAPGTRCSRSTAAPSTRSTGPGPLLVGTAGKPVELTVGPRDGGARAGSSWSRSPTRSALRYHDWVAGRRAHVHELSGGRLGYLHVPDMVGSGWAQLHRDLRVEVAREGLVVDVRENRGGHTSQLVVEKLARRDRRLGRAARPAARAATRRTRRAARSSPSPTSSPAPTATSSTRRSRRSGIGPVVGTRTWGGVIGIDSRYRLVDGTAVTQPEVRLLVRGLRLGTWRTTASTRTSRSCTRPQDWAAGTRPAARHRRPPRLDALEEPPRGRPRPTPLGDSSGAAEAARLIRAYG